MKIYTRTGDHGETGLLGGGRVSKASARVEAYGAVDELNAVLGLAAAELSRSGEEDRAPLVVSHLPVIQRSLFVIGAELATHPDGVAKAPVEAVTTDALEGVIDALEAGLEPLSNFILPGGGAAGATLHLARTVCRRAERAVVALGKVEPVGSEVVRYLNRLSDLLFVMARAQNAAQGHPESVWSG